MKKHNIYLLSSAAVGLEHNMSAVRGPGWTFVARAAACQLSNIIRGNICNENIIVRAAIWLPLKRNPSAIGCPCGHISISRFFFNSSNIGAIGIADENLTCSRPAKLVELLMLPFQYRTLSFYSPLPDRLPKITIRCAQKSISQLFRLRKQAI